MDGNHERPLGGGATASRAVVAVLGRRTGVPAPGVTPPSPRPEAPPAVGRVRQIVLTAVAVCVVAAALAVIGWVHWKAGEIPPGGTYAVVDTPPEALGGSPANRRPSPQPLVPLLPPDRISGPRPGASASRSAPPSTPPAGRPSAAATSRPGSRPITGPAGPITGFAGKCLHVPGDNAVDGAPAEMVACDGTPGERWTMASDGTVRLSGKCLTAVGDQTVDGTAVQLSACRGTAGQQWRFTAGQDLVNPHADKCLDVKDFNLADHTLVQLWTCAGSTNQKWAVPA